MKRLLSLATLYPNAARPRFGLFVARSLEALAARGDWEVTVINPIGVPPLRFGRFRALAAAARGGRENGVDVHRPQFTLVPALSGRWNPALVARAVLPLARNLHDAAPFDLVDAQFLYPDGPAAMRVARSLGLSYAVKARGADVSYWGARPSPRRQMAEAAAGAGAVLAVSEALAADLDRIGIAPAPIAVHYTGLDRDLFRPLDRIECRRRLAAQFGFALPPGAPLLATVGALIERKGQAYAIDALVELPDAVLVLAGRGADEAALRARAARLGVADRVHFLGSLDPAMLPVLLSASDALVSPSASEGLANAWVEALACGCPLVITAAGGARELLTRPDAGRIVERDARAIAAAVRALLVDPPEREAVAEAAARFDWRRHAQALDRIYSEIVEAAGGPRR